jgi:hypothetical protein
MRHCQMPVTDTGARMRGCAAAGEDDVEIAAATTNPTNVAVASLIRIMTRPLAALFSAPTGAEAQSSTQVPPLASTACR